MDRLVAVDASPLIGLAIADAFDLLRALFERVTVTEAVRDEVLAGGDRPGGPQLLAAIAEGWVEVVAAPPESAGSFPELGPGEASTLAVAMSHEGNRLVVIDERLGRARAQQLDLPVTGIVGVLLAAKRAAMVPLVRPFLERLAQHDFRIASEVVREVLAEAGELQ